MINLLLATITVIACLIAGLAITIAVSHLHTANEALAEADTADARAHYAEIALKNLRSHQEGLNHHNAEEKKNT